MKTLTYGTAMVAVLGFAGCAVEWENKQAAQEVAQLSKPAGSVYLGWRVFQEKCAGCHGTTANGTANAPDLLPRVRTMGERQFVSLVLQRYDLTQPATQVRRGPAPGEAEVEVIMQRKGAPLVMPAWQSEPRVNAHIMDLRAYLAARAEGRQGPERPLP